MKFSGLSKTETKIPGNPGKTDFLEQALGAMSSQMRMKGLQMKHGMKPLAEPPKRPRGYATHKGNVY